MQTTSVPLPPVSQSKQQIACVSNFATSRGLTLSTQKCEAIISPSAPPNLSSIQAGSIDIPIINSARCLGAWWTPSLSCSKWIDVNITKARGAFFTRGSGIFHGILNPLSSISIVESCVVPYLLSGAEAWILNCTLLQKLQSFQAELAKHILRLPKRTQQCCFNWPSIRARVLIIKLCFLQKIAKNDHSLSSRVFRSLAVSDVESLLIVRQCHFGVFSTVESHI